MNFPIPQNTKRVILVSNVQSQPNFTFRDGDLLVECNRAIHHNSLLLALSSAPINKFLFVRHNQNGHFLPNNFEKLSNTWDFVYLSSERFSFSSEDWFKEYTRKTGKTPTTGFGLYQYFRKRRPKLDIIGLGFNINDHTTPHAIVHDWDYEQHVYAQDKHFTAIYK